jgi:GNAT superfamily N-acetyltransferase
VNVLHPWNYLCYFFPSFGGNTHARSIHIHRPCDFPSDTIINLKKTGSGMEITLREDLDPDPEFYFRHQFAIYHQPYLIWDRETWEMVLATCVVYRVEVDGNYAGDVILEGKFQGIQYIVNFNLLPEYQGKGIGKAVLEEVKAIAPKLTAVTREEKLPFFLKSGFALRRTIKDYYDSGVDGYFIVFRKK